MGLVREVGLYLKDSREPPKGFELDSVENLFLKGHIGC